MRRQPMRMALVLFSALQLGLAWAQTPASDLTAHGRATCEAVMTGLHDGQPEGARQRHYAQVAKADTATLCQCVAPRFAQGMAAKPAPDEAKLLERSIAACLPHLGSLSPAAQQSVLEGPLAAQEPTPAQLTVQTQRCRDMAQGRLQLAGLDTGYLQAWEKASGLKAAELCGVCVRADMEDERGAARGEGQVWDALKSDQMLVRALHNCQHWTYRMQAR
jgi:hypothetical protein